jgi:hypothetical protein
MAMRRVEIVLAPASEFSPDPVDSMVYIPLVLCTTSLANCNLDEVDGQTYTTASSKYSNYYTYSVD